MTRQWRRACPKAGRISGLPGTEMAKAKTALRKKLAAVRAVTASTQGIRIGPVRTWN